MDKLHRSIYNLCAIVISVIFNRFDNHVPEHDLIQIFAVYNIWVAANPQFLFVVMPLDEADIIFNWVVITLPCFIQNFHPSVFCYQIVSILTLVDVEPVEEECYLVITNGLLDLL